MSSGPVLKVTDLSVTFRTEDGPLSAVDRVSLEVGDGEVLAVVGESGCGKSVTAMSLAGLLPRSATVEGSVQLDGVELIGADKRTLRSIRGREVAYIFQEPMSSLNPVFTVGRQIGEVLQVHIGLSRLAARRRAVELLKLVGIPSAERRVDDYPHQLSGGMRQRVMIAMAVACDPKVLIADEPTTALDVTIQAGILDVLRALRERLGTSVVLITHDLGVVADLADRVAVMYAGRVVETADVHELFARPQHPYTSGLLAASPSAGRHAGTHRLNEIPGLVPVLAAQPDACTFADRCPQALDICTAKQPVLEPGGHQVACWNPVREPVEV
ncbi:peptide/nickel transport system ATP-binding protein [Kribbella orskensis]|uniref:Peptide/nickel transport system ATP-binding protein n=1 Tax=Kribbella orskensis TaxID=2512216 RepID=A0ABY2BDT0_9ACTN|nr:MULTISPECIES: ABC transporter ATP-binding protein [Kribbella]TCN35827.1 peptide/nickel transport system ATP-binding protein [Kribbella sp. VKM Ac-2500]TCO17434.1 peptide/nickel transport system ATP-binding protein [Kribbella orskensis]